MREWTALDTGTFADRVASPARQEADRSVVVGVDGRSGGGKTTVAELLSEHLVDAQVVHTDDVAWYESMFGWDELLAEHVLRPLRNGVSIRYRPSAWDRRKRSGAIVADATTAFTVVEGCGATRSSLAPLLDVRIWVQSDLDQAAQRGILRDGGTASAAAFWREWEALEIPFFEQDRPWERADIFVCGTPPGDLPPGHILVSQPSAAR